MIDKLFNIKELILYTPTIQKVIELTTLSRSTIYRLVESGKFPKPVKLTTRTIGWVEEEVRKFLQEKIDSRS